MRLLTLYLRTRRTGYSVLGLVVVAVIGGFGADWLLRVPMLGGATGHALIPVVLLMPLLSACVIGASFDSPFGELEQSTRAFLPGLRSLHLLLLGSVACLGFWLVAQRWDHPDSELMLVRNLAGFAGLALLSASVVGGRLSWMPPLAFALVSLLRGHGPTGEIASWAWTIQAGSEATAALSALGLFLVGTLLAIWKGPRTSLGD